MLINVYKIWVSRNIPSVSGHKTFWGQSQTTSSLTKFVEENNNIFNPI